jgi:5-methylcytosine-specific restriction protein A
MAGIASLTERSSVLAVMAEFDQLTRDAFLKRHGFGKAKWWYAIHDGKQYDSKAIVGAAIGHQTGQPLRSTDFSGGEGSVVRKLRSLRFEVVRTEINHGTVGLPEEVSDSFPEGMRTTVLVNRVERSAKARIACIEIHGSACAVCGVRFEDMYGIEFTGLIHVHHLVPIARIEIRDVDPKNDLRPVCPNCHAAIHYGGGTRSIEDVRACLARHRAGGDAE